MPCGKRWTLPISQWEYWFRSYIFYNIMKTSRCHKDTEFDVLIFKKVKNRQIVPLCYPRWCYTEEQLFCLWAATALCLYDLNICFIFFSFESIHYLISYQQHLVEYISDRPNLDIRDQHPQQEYALFRLHCWNKAIQRHTCIRYSIARQPL